MITRHDDFVVGTLILFSDGGPPEGQLLHRGTRKSCQEIAELLSAISYSGERPVKKAMMPIMPSSDSIWSLSDPDDEKGGE